jgi:aspartyl protease family protein
MRIMAARGDAIGGARSRYSEGKLLRSAFALFGSFTATALVLGIVFKFLMPSMSSLHRQTAAPVAPSAPARSEARPAPNALVYRADGSGHFLVDGSVNGAPVRFLVDTGATAVTLSPEDARAAGLARAELDFSETVTTAHGVARAAATTLRDVRLQQLELDDVPALVMEQSMPVSLLGMSFLKRLNGYSIRDGVLTMEW